MAATSISSATSRHCRRVGNERKNVIKKKILKKLLKNQVLTAATPRYAFDFSTESRSRGRTPQGDDNGVPREGRPTNSGTKPPPADPSSYDFLPSRRRVRAPLSSFLSRHFSLGFRSFLHPSRLFRPHDCFLRVSSASRTSTIRTLTHIHTRVYRTTFQFRCRDPLPALHSHTGKRIPGAFFVKFTEFNIPRPIFYIIHEN